MTLNESVAKLQTLLPALKPSDASFAASLIASYAKYKGLSPKQEPWIGKLIARAETPVAVAPVANVGGFEGVVALFAKAKESGLKFPKVRLSLDGVKLILSLNGAKSKRPGHVSISGEGVYPNRAFYGTVSPDGAFTPFKGGLPGLTDLLAKLASNPGRVAKEHGKLTGNCCFCNKEVGKGKEKRSVLVGYGPDCAEHYGLKAEWLAAAEKAEAKASVAPLKLEGPWIGSVPTTEEPTLTVTPAAQVAIDGLAESLAKTTGAVSVTVTDGDNVDSYGPNPGDLGDLDYDDYEKLLKANDLVGGGLLAAISAPKVCLFCEQPSPDAKVLNGIAVCPACALQLA